MTANDTALSPLQIFSAFLIATTSISSLIAYLLVLAVLYLYFKEFKSNFYYIVISLAICDTIFLAVGLFYMVPCTILKKDIGASAPYVAGRFGELSFFAGATHLCYVAVNRLIYASTSGVKHPKLDKIFNSPLSVSIWITLFWISGLSMPIALQIAGCHVLYDYEYMAFLYKCYDSSSISSAFSSRVMLAENFVCGFLTCFIAAVHALAWIVVYWRGRNGGSKEIKQHRKRETRLLIQFTLISSSLVLYYATFWGIPHWAPGSRSLVLISYFGIASCAVNPWTYLAFNKLMKARAKHLIFDVILQNNQFAQIRENGQNALESV